MLHGWFAEAVFVGAMEAAARISLDCGARLSTVTFLCYPFHPSPLRVVAFNPTRSVVDIMLGELHVASAS